MHNIDDKNLNQKSLFHWLTNAYEINHLNAVHFKKNNIWKTLSYSQYFFSIYQIQQHLLKLNILPKSKIAIMSSTRWEWAAIDIAVLSMQSQLIPLYPNLTDEDVLFILDHSEADLIFVDTPKVKSQFERIQSQLNKKIQCILIDDIIFDFENASQHETQITQFITNTQHINPEEIATIIYTSGTTGQPKGVTLSYQALYSEINEAFGLFQIGVNDISLAFLPFAHVMGRVEHWGCLAKNAQVAYAESIDQLKNNLVEIKPTFLIAVPRIFEKIYSSIMAKVNSNTIKKKLFDQALHLAEQMNYYRKTKQTAPLHLVISYEALNQIIFSPIKNAFGGRLKFSISGGAPLSPELGQFFSYLGIKIFEGYGLTETFAAVTVNTETQWELGTVGKPIGDVQIKFAADGEILVKSKKCLTNYYKNPEATKISIDKEGYFATGDIGEFTNTGFLKITDRKKDLIKTAGGKYVAPQKLEGLLKREPLISQVLICGDQKKYITALITVESINEDADSAEKNRIEKTIQNHITHLNSELASYESIKQFKIIYTTWSPVNGFLTPSMKVKRKFIMEKYSDLILQMYE